MKAKINLIEEFFATMLSPLKCPSYDELWHCHIIVLPSSNGTHLLNILSLPSLNK